MAAKPILAATDLSEPADEAIRQAHAWARLRAARLCVCHVAPRLLGSEQLFPPEAREPVDRAARGARLAEEVRARTAAVTGRAPDDFDVLVAEGSPPAELVRAAERRDAGCIVVASHGLPGLAHIFLGDIAERVVRDARCPVLVARPHRATGRILVATGFSDAGFAALAAAAEQARLTGARLVVLASIEPQLEVARAMAELAGSGYSFVDDEWQSARRDAERRLRALLARVGSDGDVVVTDASPAAAIVRAAAERDVDLVALGAAEPAGLRRVLVGKVTERVTRHAPCSVLVARPA